MEELLRETAEGFYSMIFVIENVDNTNYAQKLQPVLQLVNCVILQADIHYIYSLIGSVLRPDISASSPNYRPVKPLYSHLQADRVNNVERAAAALVRAQLGTIIEAIDSGFDNVVSNRKNVIN